MKLKLTKNSTIILTSIILVLSIALGFLVWRVNQKETTAPTESEAEGEGTSCSTGADCTEITCYWPYVSYCHNNACECRLRENQTVNPCTDKDPRCTPPSPGGDYELCHYWDSASQKMITEPGCEDDAPNTKEAVCKTTCSSCNNPYFYQTRYVLIEEEPICGDGVKDEGEDCDNGSNNGKVCTPAYGSSCTYCSINCDLVTVPGDYCGDGKVTPPEDCDPQSTEPNCDIGMTCNSSCLCEAPPATCGDGVLDEGEQCENYVGREPAGAPCTWEQCDHTTCRCLPGDLVLTKNVVESCKDEGTANPSSELVYTITLTNNGDGPARPDKIEDVLDPKILSSGVIPTILGDDDGSLVNRRGVYSAGKILWDFNDSIYGTIGMLPGSSFQTSYKVVISKDNFGEYNNTATLTNLDGTTLIATAKIDADCVVTVPQTGIFDSTLGRISVGFILLLIGGVVYNLPSEIFINKFNKNGFKYRVKFENNIWKKN